MGHWSCGIGHLALAMWNRPFGIGHLTLAIFACGNLTLAIFACGNLTMVIWHWSCGIGHFGIGHFGMQLIFSILSKFIAHVINFTLNSISGFVIMMVKFIAVEFFPSLCLSSYQHWVPLSIKYTTSCCHHISKIMHSFVVVSPTICTTFGVIK